MASPVDSTVTYDSDVTAYDWLVNDWDDDSTLWKNVQGTYTVSLRDQGFYGIQLRNVAEELSGNLKSIAVVPSAGGPELEQVDSLIPPGAGQYRMSTLPTGRIEFSSASNGVSYVVKYISSGALNRRDSTTGIGFLDDGTRLYSKTLDCTIASASLIGSVAHGIANALTNNRILDVRTQYTPSNATISEALENTKDVYRMQWDDTDLIITRGDSATEEDYRIYVVYTEDA